MDLELILFFAFIIGLCLGSFLNVAIYRLPRDLSVVNPRRSFCPGCKRQLTWWENIPVLGWLCLGGKCRTCRSKISGQYPLVELLSGIAAVGVALRFGVTPVGFVVYALLLSLIVITFIDFEFRIIPNVISFPGITLGLLLGIAAEYSHFFSCQRSELYCPMTTGAMDSLVGMLIGGGFFELIGRGYEWWAKREGIGGGDVKLMAMTGAIMGWRSVAPTIFMGSLVGAVIGVAVALLQGTGRKTEIAFGPWLAVGAVLYIFADLPYFRF